MMPGIGPPLLLATGLLAAVGFLFGFLLRLAAGDRSVDAFSFSAGLVGGIQAWSGPDDGAGAQGLQRLPPSDPSASDLAEETDLPPSDAPPATRVALRVGLRERSRPD